MYVNANCHILTSEGYLVVCGIIWPCLGVRYRTKIGLKNFSDVRRLREKIGKKFRSESLKFSIKLCP